MTGHSLVSFVLKSLVAIAVLASLAVAAYLTRDSWLQTGSSNDEANSTNRSGDEGESESETKQILLTDHAIDNLRLVAKPTLPQSYWRSIQIPGMVVDLPGRSDQGVITPVTGVVTQIHQFPGNTVRPGEPLFTIRLLSESLHASQSELFKATQNIQIAESQLQRLQSASGAIPESRTIEVENQIARLNISVLAYRRELSSRGLTPEQIDQASLGNFVTEIQIRVPSATFQAEFAPTLDAAEPSQSNVREPNTSSVAKPDPIFEVEELRVDMGHQVQAGQTLCLLANHQSLAIEGRAFRDETLLLERSVQNNWPVEVDFQENAAAQWPPVIQEFYIRQIANNIDPVNRTFGFQIALENQSRVVDVDGATQILWRFRPGQKVRLLVHIERLEDVLVVPRDAVARDLAEAFVFTQNVNTFDRKPVRIVAEDRLNIVLANDGSLVPGSFVVQNAADQLNRMTKSQSGDGLPEGYHIHADGSLHKNEDEGK